ncbi:TIGR02234 family membrane protein [Streptomyces durbertensis]|uniref:TIGR02234 family membrane protein n=1 Tax=Streptomyces durbertensis TaxID=2448886 RepID=A0ABR6ECR6_9ACTN|nr:TIGR02234 family membrane protein [Streptomyces durbertensis]MBB1242882.1 TIGR02234 family membrane protein [Streptomyces durbertensis]
MTAKPPTPSPGAARRALGVAVLGGALGAALVLIAAGQTWVEGHAVRGGGRLPLHATGSEVTGLPSALALVALAALVAVFAVRRAARTAVAVLLALCGLGVVASSVAATFDTATLDGKAAEATGLVGATATDVTFSAWPYVAAVGGVLLLLAGVLAQRFGPAWPAMGGRYERSGGRRVTRRPADPERPDELWRALDRGEDPTGGRPDDEGDEADGGDRRRP